MGKIKLIATDLDGTLLNSAKEITPRTLAALESAVENGTLFVPATGRSFLLAPPEIIEMPFVKYMICLNGADIRDKETGEILASAEIPNELALSVLDYLDTQPVIYECCYDNRPTMSAAHKALARDYTVDDETYYMIMNERRLVPDLKQALLEWGAPVQKIQCYFRDVTKKPEYMKLFGERFPELAVVSSIINNVEMTNKNATKGGGVRMLCEILGIDMAEVMTFGDDINDISMIEPAGYGVAMGNANPAVKTAAALVAPDCDNEGVAYMVEKYVLGKTE